MRRSLSAAIELYLARCRVEAKSPRTVRAYTETLRRFQRLLAADRVPDRLDAVGPAEVIRYLDHFTPLSLETRHRYFREVRCFFRWCVETGFLAETPFRGLRNVRLPQRIVQPFTPSEVRRLIACTDPTRPVGLRDRAMLLTLLDTGLRCSELVALDWRDWERARGWLRVRHGKGNKQRVMPIARACAAALEAYVVARGRGPAEPRGDFHSLLGLHTLPPKDPPQAVPARETLDELVPFLPPPIQASLRDGTPPPDLEGEHRKVTIIFISLRGGNELLLEAGPAAVLADLQAYVSRVVQASRCGPSGPPRGASACHWLAHPAI